MQIHPAIAALRSPSSQQRRASAQTTAAMRRARDSWLDLDQTRRLIDGLERYGTGGRLDDCSELNRVMGDPELAQTWVNTLFAATLKELRAWPFGEAPFRYRVASAFATMQLLEAGEATLTLAAYEPLEGIEEPSSALFSDRHSIELILTGAASGLKHTIALPVGGEGGPVRSERKRWCRGDQIETRPMAEARHIVRVERSLVLLQLTREPLRARPVREVSLATGAVVRTASGDKSASQTVMALSVLGALRAYNSLDVMEETALNLEEDVDVRWEAARQALGLGAVRGMGVLEALAIRDDDPLSQPAIALKEQLLSGLRGSSLTDFQCRS